MIHKTISKTMLRSFIVFINVFYIDTLLKKLKCKYVENK